MKSRIHPPGEKGFHFMATGIGSMPSLDVQGTCRKILDHLPGIPFWPQFPKRSHLEDMTIQFTEGLSILEVDGVGRRPLFTSGDRAHAMATLYEHILAEDTDHFALSSNCAPGLHEMMALIRGRPEEAGTYVKGQTVGPLTLAMAARDREGMALIHDPECREALCRALAVKALWQVRELAQSGRETVLFLDEPSLSGFGSAFSPVERHEVVAGLLEFISFLRERSSALIGIHCCGNTDWSMLLEAGPDIINFDAFGYMEAFLLYRAEIVRFLAEGGAIAWGIVPTSGEEANQVSSELLLNRLREGLNRLRTWGVDEQTLRRQSLLTPACGMGNLEDQTAAKILDLLSELSRVCSGGC